MSEKTYLVFQTKIQESYDNLSGAERKIANYILKNPEEVLTGTAASIAAKAGTSTATVIRFSKSCGFAGLSDMKYALRQENDVQEHGEPGEQIKKDDSVMTIKQKVLGYHNVVINSMMSKWNESAYELTVEALLGANHILIIGEGGSRSSAYCFLDVALQLGLDCEISVDSVMEAMKISNMKPGDVVLGITYTGRMWNTVDSLRLAKQQGLTTIGMIGAMKSPCMEYVDLVLNTNMVKGRYFSSALSVRVSELSVIEVLYSMLALHLGRNVENEVYNNPFIDAKRIGKKS